MVTDINPNDWRPFGNKVEYCLSQTIEEKCNLALNEPVIGVVLAFNLLKCLMMFYIICLMKAAPQTLLTVGDSIASFLRQKDETTKDLCLMNRKDLTEWKNSINGTTPKPKTLLAPPRRRWNYVVGASRWVCLIAL